MPTSTKSTTTTVTRTTRARKPRTEPVTTVHPTPTHDDIATRAYELFLGDGARHGRDLEHWLRAELELRERVGVSGS
ncbi:MAG TPA: DUF2934 domain-containing protein [Vicinamibacterales bacterium]